MNKNTKLQSAHDGAFLVNDTAANNPAVQGAMASYMQQLQREAAYRRAVREGRVATSQSGNWHISDRD